MTPGGSTTGSSSGAIIANIDGMEGTASAVVDPEAERHDSLIPGDVDMDGDVDLDDIGPFMKVFKSRSGDDRYDKRVDFNEDGWVDVLDLALMMANLEGG